MSMKPLISLIVAFLIISIASSCTANIDIIPDNFKPSEQGLIYGTIVCNEQETPQNITIIIKKGNDFIGSYTTPSINYANDVNNPSVLSTGVFYKEISLADTGAYTANLYLQENPRVLKQFNVKTGISRDLKVEIIDYAIQNSNMSVLLSITNERSNSRTVDLDFYGRYSEEAQDTRSVHINPGETKYVQYFFNAGNYAPSDGVFLLIIKAEDTYSESLPAYKLIRRGTISREGVYVQSINITKNAFAGSVVEAEVSITNTLAITKKTFLDYSIAGQTYRQSINIMPLRTTTHKIYIPIPETAKGQETIIASMNEDDVYSMQTATINIQELVHDFTSSLFMNWGVVQNNKNATIHLITVNTGTTPDDYELTVSWPYHQLSERSFKLEAGEIRNTTIKLLVPEDTLRGSHNVTVKVCALAAGTCISNNYNLVTNPLPRTILKVVNSSVQGSTNSGSVFTLKVMNNEGIERTYSFSIAPPTGFSGDIHTYPNNEFVLADGEEKEIYVYATSRNQGVFEIDYSLRTGGELISGGTLSLMVNDQNQKASQITGFMGGTPDFSWGFFSFILILVFGLGMFAYLFYHNRFNKKYDTLRGL